MARRIISLALVSAFLALTMFSAFAAEQKKQAKPTTKTVASAVELYGNKEIRGWLVVPGTDISRALAFSPKDNAYYENRTIAGEAAKANASTVTAEYFSAGTVFGTRFGSAGSSRNYTVFGHNWSNVRAPYRVGVNDKDFGFAELPSYTSLEFLTAHPYIYMATDKTSGAFKVFTVMYTKESNIAYLQGYSGEHPDTMAMWEKNIAQLKRATLFTGVDVNEDDTLLTLSTCTRHFGQHTDQRFVVVARLLRPDEKDTDAVKYEVNPSPELPKW
jgi:sortase B